MEAMVKFLPRGDRWDSGGTWNMVEDDYDRSTQNMVREGEENGWAQVNMGL